MLDGIKEGDHINQKYLNNKFDETLLKTYGDV